MIHSSFSFTLWAGMMDVVVCALCCVLCVRFYVFTTVVAVVVHSVVVWHVVCVDRPPAHPCLLPFCSLGCFSVKFIY